MRSSKGATLGWFADFVADFEGVGQQFHRNSGLES